MYGESMPLDAIVRNSLRAHLRIKDTAHMNQFMIIVVAAGARPDDIEQAILEDLQTMPPDVQRYWLRSVDYQPTRVPANDEPVGERCPGCGQPPLVLLGGGTQAFCGADDCHVLSWDPTKSVEQFADQAERVILPNWLTEE